MAEGSYTCPCGHPSVVAGEPFETDEPDGRCSDREDHAPQPSGAPAPKCKCHDKDGRLILTKGTPEAYAYQGRKTAAATEGGS